MSAQPDTSENQQTNTEPDTQRTDKENIFLGVLICLGVLLFFGVFLAASKFFFWWLVFLFSLAAITGHFYAVGVSTLLPIILCLSTKGKFIDFLNENLGEPSGYILLTIVFYVCGVVIVLIICEEIKDTLFGESTFKRFAAAILSGIIGTMIIFNLADNQKFDTERLNLRYTRKSFEPVFIMVPDEKSGRYSSYKPNPKYNEETKEPTKQEKERLSVGFGSTNQTLEKNFYWLVGLGFLLFIVTRDYELPEIGTKENTEPLTNDAHFMTYKEAEAAKLTDNQNGLLIGYHPENGKPLRYSGEKHLTTFAGTRGGKGTCCQIPALLDYQGSILAIDPKAENCAITAKFRRDVLGQNVFILSPYKTIADEQLKAEGFTKAHYNPLLDLDTTSPEFADNVLKLAESLVYNSSKDSFWDDSARILLACLIMFVCLTENEKNRTLKRARELLCLPWEVNEKKNKDDLPKDMKAYQDGREIISLRVALYAAEKTGYTPLVERARQFVNETRSKDEVIASAQIQTEFLSSLPLADCLSKSDFRLSQLKPKKSNIIKAKPVTVYLVLPADKLQTAGRWFRLIVTAAINELSATQRAEKDVLFLVDEAKLLGELPAIKTALSFSAGAGVKLWSFWQSMASLEENYGKSAAEFFDNSGVLQFFTPDNMNTAEHISKRCGTRIIRTTNTSNGTNYSSSGISNSTNTTECEREAPLISAYELMGLPSNKQIAFISGHKSGLMANRFGYWEDENYQGKYSPNPYRKD